jgi:hypothetical protein
MWSTFSSKLQKHFVIELHFEAPLAKFENEELTEYNDFQGVSETSNLLNTDMSIGSERHEHSENFAI